MIMSGRSVREGSDCRQASADGVKHSLDDLLTPRSYDFAEQTAASSISRVLVRSGSNTLCQKARRAASLAGCMCVSTAMKLIEIFILCHGGSVQELTCPERFNAAGPRMGNLTCVVIRLGWTALQPHWLADLAEKQQVLCAFVPVLCQVALLIGDQIHSDMP